MKVAVTGSRNLNLDITKYLPKGITLIVSGGAKGIDALAEKYADENKIPKLILLPDYKKYGKAAPLVRNKFIVDNADYIIAFWDGESKGTKFIIDYASSTGKKIVMHMFKTLK